MDDLWRTSGLEARERCVISSQGWWPEEHASERCGLSLLTAWSQKCLLPSDIPNANSSQFWCSKIIFYHAEGATTLTQYINAQYQTSTKNGNFSMTRLNHLSLNNLVSGLVTVASNHHKLRVRVLQSLIFSLRPGEGGSGVFTAWYTASCHDSSSSFDLLSQPGDANMTELGFLILRLTKHPVTRRKTTAAGSNIAPGPMMRKKFVGCYWRLVARDKLILVRVRWHYQATSGVYESTWMLEKNLGHVFCY